jgi:hypothetical protein
MLSAAPSPVNTSATSPHPPTTVSGGDSKLTSPTGSIDAVYDAGSAVVGSAVAVGVSVSVGEVVGCAPADYDGSPPRQPAPSPLTVRLPLYARYSRRETPESVSLSSLMRFRLA